MKKFQAMALALACAGFLLSSCENKDEEHVNVATFENVSLGADSINSYTDDGVYAWTSGDFGFSTGVAYTGTYYYNYVVSNQKSNAFSSYVDQYHSAPGGPVAGNNFVVAYQDSYSEGASLSIQYANALTYIPGTYVTNNAYAVNSMTNGDTYAKKFEDGDWFLLTFTGYLAGIQVGSVEFYLADFRNGKSLIVKDWTYVDLTGLGIVDEVRCTLTSSDNTDGMMNTPGYFCLDNFGAKK